MLWECCHSGWLCFVLQAKGKHTIIWTMRWVPVNTAACNMYVITTILSQWPWPIGFCQYVQLKLWQYSMGETMHMKCTFPLSSCNHVPTPLQHPSSALHPAPLHLSWAWQAGHITMFHHDYCLWITLFAFQQLVTCTCDHHALQCKQCTNTKSHSLHLIYTQEGPRHPWGAAYPVCSQPLPACAVNMSPVFIFSLSYRWKRTVTVSLGALTWLHVIPVLVCVDVLGKTAE